MGYKPPPRLPPAGYVAHCNGRADQPVLVAVDATTRQIRVRQGSKEARITEEALVGTPERLAAVRDSVQRAGISYVDFMRTALDCHLALRDQRRRLHEQIHELPTWRIERIRSPRARLGPRLRFARRCAVIGLRELWGDLVCAWLDWRELRAKRTYGKGPG